MFLLGPAPSNHEEFTYKNFLPSLFPLLKYFQIIYIICQVYTDSPGKKTWKTVQNE